MEKLEKKKIYIAGHTGLVGSSLVRFYKRLNSVELLLTPHSQLDLTRQIEVEAFVSQNKPDIVINAAGKVGGIQANASFPAEFIYENLMIEANLVHSAWKAGVKKFLNFGSSCIYPKYCSQPMTPDMFMTGKLEPTNEPYAIAKFAGLSLCSSYNTQYNTHYINVIPSNLYGPGDTFDLNRCHVIAALIHKFHSAKHNARKEVILWGTGKPRRDFLFVDDFAEACDLLIKTYDNLTPINVGAESPCAIEEVAPLLAEIIGFEGKIVWDSSRPDGAPERFLEASEIRKLGWSAKTNLKNGLTKTYAWFLESFVEQIEKENKLCAS